MTRYQTRFIEVVRFIEANLDEDLDVEQLCQLANLSKYHFHRQCSLFFGMSVMSLARLLRLKRAAYQLAYRDSNIIDIAITAGYDSHEAFSRAFKRCFKLSPSDFRLSPDWALWQTKYQTIVELRTKIMNTQVAVSIVDFPETLIAVMEHRAAPHLLGASIQKFIQWRKAHGLSPSKSKTFNLVYDDPSITADKDYRFDLACAVKRPLADNYDGIVNKVIPAGKCAKVRHVGSDDTLATSVNFLYQNWLQDNEYELRDFPLFFHRVSFFPEVSEQEMVTDIYLPVQ
ncbi:AraC family transcriptional regulator [Thalassotalea insulae]|uniref:AraC family transcriptional regulator n=1 Tax=Thalassotalea insulae TaxID=2056778 RepID=A0ABQ6GUD1_9GAMM|nr:AraC family transcriptional regulator [Thalassotalea insulae]GLX78774.1 AraC family transcriptional regulator [Thalassotalea insulae]